MPAQGQRAVSLRHLAVSVLLAPCLPHHCGASAAASASANGTQAQVLQLPQGGSGQDDAYLCAVFSPPEDAKSIVGVVPHAKKEVVHHMLLFGACQRHHSFSPL